MTFYLTEKAAQKLLKKTTATVTVIKAPEKPPKQQDEAEEEGPLRERPARGWCKTNLGKWESEGGWRVGYIREWVRTDTGSEASNRVVVWNDAIPYVFKLCPLRQFLAEQWTADQLLNEIKQAYTHWRHEHEEESEETDE